MSQKASQWLIYMRSNMATPPPKKGIIWVHTRLVPSFAKKAIVHIAAGQFCVTLKLNQKIKRMNKEEKNHLIG